MPNLFTIGMICLGLVVVLIIYLISTYNSLIRLNERVKEAWSGITVILKLQDQLVDTEEKLQASRRFYNAGARDFNTRIIQFPVNILFGSRFEKYTYFTVDEEEMKKLDKAPKVEF